MKNGGTDAYFRTYISKPVNPPFYHHKSQINTTSPLGVTTTFFHEMKALNLNTQRRDTHSVSTEYSVKRMDQR